MKRLLRLCLLAGLTAAVAWPSAPIAGRPAALSLGTPVRLADHVRVKHPELDGESDEVAGQLLIRYRPETGAQEIEQVHGRQGVSPAHQVPELKLESVKLPAGKTAASALQALRNEASVLSAEPVRVLHASAYTPTDPDFAAAQPTSHDGSQSQWGLRQVQAPAAWAGFRGPGSVIVAVLDTGVDAGHPDLQGHLLPGFNFVDQNTDTWDDHGHGTLTAGIAGAVTDNGVGIASVGFNTVQVLPVKVLDALGNGSEVMVANGIAYAADHGARVISLSLGGTTYSQALQDAVRYAWARGCVIFAAGGNSGDATPQYPASDSHVVGVTATDQSDHAAPFDSRGNEISLAAPGVSIISTMPTYPVTMTSTQGYFQGYDAISGTSTATPLVSGLAALLIAKAGGSLLAQDVVQQLERSADAVGATGWNPSTGWGRVNAASLLAGQFRPDSTGSVRGQILGTSGAPLAGATVSAGPAGMVTGADGFYRLTGLAAGPATVRVQSAGSSYSSQPVQVQPGADTYVDVQTSAGVPPAAPALVNGGFEAAGFGGWSTGGGAPAPSLSTAQVHSGSYSALLGTSSGAELGGDSWIAQTVQVQIPSGKTRARLSFWYWAASTDVAAFDRQQAQLQDPSGKALVTIFEAAANPRAWQQTSADLTPYAGASVRIWFNVHQDGAGDPTWMYVDDVEVTYS